MEERLWGMVNKCPCPKITVEQARNWLITEGALLSGKTFKEMVTMKGKDTTIKYLIILFALEIIEDTNLSCNSGEDLHSVVIQRLKFDEEFSKAETIQSTYKDWVVRTVIKENYTEVTFATALRLVAMKKCMRKLAVKAGYDLCDFANKSITEDLIKQVK